MPTVNQRGTRVRQMANPTDTVARKILAAVEAWAKKECTDLRVEQGLVDGKVIVRAHPRCISYSKEGMDPVQQMGVRQFADRIDEKLDRNPNHTLVKRVKNSAALEITFTL